MKNNVLLILDGFAITDNEKGNAIKGNISYIESLLDNYPNCKIKCSGEDVGLPDGQMGNSEVGHLNIGAGRVIYQDLTHISQEIKTGNFYRNIELLSAINNAKEKNTDLHLLILLSDGGVHSHINHLYAMLNMCKDNELDRVYIHAIMDGRDTSPSSGINYIKDLKENIKKIGIGKIATVSGRYYAMDRDNRFDRIEKAYNAMVKGIGSMQNSAEDAVLKSYENEIYDEFIIPTVISDNGNINRIKENDSVIFLNFRPDRARQITRALTSDKFDKFDAEKLNLTFVCMSRYDGDLKNVKVAYKPRKIENGITEYLSNLGKKQLRIAETEKYAHITFFFNGGIEEPFKDEKRILIESPKVATYDLKPEMSINEVTESAIKEISKNEYDFIVINFANPDMVGHTGNFDATQKAIREVDRCTKELVNTILDNNGTVFITSDHGNSEEMINELELPITSHTTNPTFLIIVDKEKEYNIISGGSLADIAPTILDKMNIEKPMQMSGKSLIVKK